MSAATASPARPTAWNARNTAPRSATATYASRPSTAKSARPATCVPSADRELALQDPRRRPRDGGERDEDASPPLLCAERQGRGRRRHRRIESASAGGDRSEQAVRFAARPGREVERRRRPGRGAVAERDRPQAVDRDDRLVAVAQLALEDPLAAAAILVGADPPVAEVADQQVAARTRRSSTARARGPTARSAERSSCRRDATRATSCAVGRELVDVAEPLPATSSFFAASCFA